MISVNTCTTLDKCALTEVVCNPEGYTFCGWVLVSCWRRSSLDGPSWGYPSFDSRIWCTETLGKKRWLVMMRYL